MSIVAISETTGSLGAEIGRWVAKSLQYEFADREILARAAERYGEAITEMTHGTDEMPTFWERMTDPHHRSMTYVKAIMLEMAARDDVVLVGRACTIVLREVAHALRVRVSAPEPLRAERVEQQQGFLPDSSLQYIRDADHERAARVRFLYRLDWNDPLLYDLVLNTERLTADDAARVVCAAVGLPRFRTTSDSRRLLIDASLVALAQAALLATPATRSLALDVSCRDGDIVLRGTVREQDARVAEQTIARIPGLASVRIDVGRVVPRRLAG